EWGKGAVEWTESICIMMKRFLFLSLALVGGCIFPACDFAKFSANVETSKLKEKVAELEKEREDAALDAELEEARRQLQIALKALEIEVPDEEGAISDEEGVVDVGPDGPGDFANVPKAIVVEESPLEVEPLPDDGQAVAIQEAVPAALLNAGDHQIFFAELSRFGEWFETREYGFVWQPTALGADPTWRPYTRGRWVNSDQGWTWLSDEPFGWAVYHYGRWVLLAEHGWVWVPGDDWAPAWVSWRQNDDYLGWAPLPPETLYDEVYDYDPGIDLAYDVSPDYYNFVPVDHFYEPVQPHCVPQVTVITIIINTRNVTRFSMRGNHVHCGGPDFGWVNRHARRPARRCQLDFGGGHDHFAHRNRPRLHEDRLHVFAPRVDAPWNAAVCPSRVAGDLGRVEIVRAGKREIKRDLRHRHHEASVRRHEGAREAMGLPECQVALRNNLQRRRTSRERQGGNDLLEDRQQRRAKAEASLRAATEAVAAVERRMQDRKLQPKERAEARRMIEEAGKEVATARESLRTRGPAEAPRSVAPDPGTGDLLAEQKEQKLSEAKREEMARQRAEEVKRRALVEQKQAEEAKRSALAEQKLSEAKREEMARQRAEEVKRRALAEQKTEEAKSEEIARQRAEEVKRRNLVEQKAEEVKRRALTEQKEQKLAEAKREEMARQRAEEVKRRALVEQKAEDAKRRALAEQKEQKLAEAKREEIARQRAEEGKRRALAERKQVEAKRVEMERQQAEEAQRRALAQQRAEETRRREVARQQAEEVKRRALAQQKAEDAKRRALAEQKMAEARRQAMERQRAEDARRQALARQKVEDSRRRAELDAQRKAQIDTQRRAEAVRARADAQRRAELDAQRKAAAVQARRQADAQRAAAEARGRAEAKSRAEAQAAARRQKTEAVRREAPKNSRSRKTR
ncbi:MAG: hypothetical protein QGI77_00285, partial [Roseibacillus sp.]|nr:hypothetical protein [Roseibacillus sp.]